MADLKHMRTLIGMLSVWTVYAGKFENSNNWLYVTAKCANDTIVLLTMLFTLTAKYSDLK